MSVRVRCVWAVASAVILLGQAVAPAWAGPMVLAGDGSASNNPDLTRPGALGCPDCAVDAAPADWNDPFFVFDWKLGLRGSYVVGSTGSAFAGSALPSVSFRHTGLRSSFGVAADAEITQSTSDPFRIARLGTTVDGSYRLDEATTLSAMATLGLTQAPPSLPTIESSPQILRGGGELAATRDFGGFAVGLRGSVGRVTYGPSTGAGGVPVDNTWRSNTSVGAGLRVSVPLTPVLSVFTDGSASYAFYDGTPPSLSDPLDGATYTGKAGVAYALNTTLSGEASVGLGLRHFAAGYAPVVSTLYDAKLSFRPDETLTLNAGVSTAIEDPGTTAGATARVTYSANADANYIVNPWLGVRGSLGWYRSDAVGAVSTESGYSAGAGLDYKVNENTTLTADYGYAHADAPPATPTDTHTFTVGVTFAK